MRSIEDKSKLNKRWREDDEEKEGMRGQKVKWRDRGKDNK